MPEVADGQPTRAIGSQDIAGSFPDLPSGLLSAPRSLAISIPPE
jgi:hypothetical protein